MKSAYAYGLAIVSSRKPFCCPAHSGVEMGLGPNARKPNRHLGFDRLSTLEYHRWIEFVKLSSKSLTSQLDRR